jgi:hypothetical protein
MDLRSAAEWAQLIATVPIIAGAIKLILWRGSPARPLLVRWRGEPWAPPMELPAYAVLGAPKIPVMNVGDALALKARFCQVWWDESTQTTTCEATDIFMLPSHVTGEFSVEIRHPPWQEGIGRGLLTPEMPDAGILLWEDAAGTRYQGLADGRKVESWRKSWWMLLRKPPNWTDWGQQ